VIGTVSLALATIAFVGTHLAMSHPYRGRLIGQMGEARFQILYSLVAFVTLGLMIWAFQHAEPWPLWTAPDWWWNVASVIMLLASILLVGSLMGNPAFPHPDAAKRVMKPARGVFAITRHPMNWSFALWALVHISVYGSPRNLIVSAGILVLAGAGSVGQDRKKRSVVGKKWRDWEARTSFVPFAALFSGRAKWNAAFPGWIAIGGGFALWLVVTSLHAPNASPLGWLGLTPL
jgi:uncharacterized membrane protein